MLSTQFKDIKTGEIYTDYDAMQTALTEIYNEKKYFTDWTQYFETVEVPVGEYWGCWNGTRFKECLREPEHINRLKDLFAQYNMTCVDEFDSNENLENICKYYTTETTVKDYTVGECVPAVYFYAYLPREIFKIINPISEQMAQEEMEMRQFYNALEKYKYYRVDDYETWYKNPDDKRKLEMQCHQYIGKYYIQITKENYIELTKIFEFYYGDKMSQFMHNVGSLVEIDFNYNDYDWESSIHISPFNNYADEIEVLEKQIQALKNQANEINAFFANI